MNAKPSRIALGTRSISSSLPAASSAPRSLVRESAKIAASLPRSRLRVRIEEGEGASVRIKVLCDEQEALSIRALARDFFRSAERAHLRGPVVIESESGRRSLPLLAANLTFHLQRETDERVLTGTACAPLPTFGLFNGISVAGPVSSCVSLRLAPELEKYGIFDAKDVALCFELEQSAAADGPMIDLATRPTGSTLLLNPRSLAFLLEVESADLPGLQLRTGMLGVAPSPVFHVAPSHVAGRSGHGKLQLSGSVEIKPLSLTITGDLVADFRQADGDERDQEPRLQLLGRGSCEFMGGVGCGSRATFNSSSATFIGWADEHAARIRASGRLVEKQLLCRASGLNVVAAEEVWFDALLCSNSESYTLQTKGDLLLDLVATPEAQPLRRVPVRARLHQAELSVTSKGVTLAGLLDARRAMFENLSGWLLLRLTLGEAPRDWTMSVQAPGSRKSIVLRPRGA